MAGEKEVSFTIRAKDAASSVLKQVEKSAQGTVEKLFSFKAILSGMSGAITAFSLATVIKDLVDLGIAADKTFRQIAANLPTGIEGIARLKDEIHSLAYESGRSLASMQAAATEIARLGVSSGAELTTRLRAATELADATGADLIATVQGLDQVMDTFGLSASQAEETLAKLVSAAKGRTDVESMFAAFQAAAPTLVKLGIDADTATKALVTLLDKGIAPARAGKLLAQYDSEALKELAADATIATTALSDLQAQAKLVEDGAGRAAERVRTEFNSTLEELGTRILPVVTDGFKALTGVIQLLSNLSLDNILALLSGNPAQVAAALASQYAGGGGGLGPRNGPGAFAGGAGGSSGSWGGSGSSGGGGLPKTTAELNELKRAAAEAKRELAELLKLEREIGDKENDRLIESLKKLGVQYNKTAEATFKFVDATSEMLNKFRETNRGPAKDLTKGDPATVAQKMTAEIQMQARVIDQAVSGAIELADAFGMVSRNVADMARGLSQALTGIGPLRDAMKKMGEVNGTTHLDVVVAALPVIGGVASVVSGFVNAIQSQRAAAKQIQSAAEAFARSVQQWATENNRNPAAGSLVGLMERRRNAFAAQGLTEADAGRIRSADLSTITNPQIAAIIALQKEAVAQIDALLGGSIDLLREDFFGGIRRELNALAGPVGEYLNALEDINREYANNINSASALGATTEQLAQITELYNRKLEALTANKAFQEFSDANQADYKARQDALNAVQLELQRLREVAERQLDTANDALAVNQKELSAQQQSVGSLRQVFESLKSAAAGLLLNSSYSTLSPIQQLDEAKRQYQEQLSRARGGDQTATANLPQFFNAVLAASEAVNAHGAGFVADFDSIQADLASLTEQYGAQLTTEEKILAVLQTQSDKLTVQIAVLVAQLKATQDMAKTFTVGAYGDPNYMKINAVMTDPATGQLVHDPQYDNLPTYDFFDPAYQALLNPGTSTSTGGWTPQDEERYQAYQAAHGNNAEYTYQEWVTNGRPAYARGGMFGGGLRLVGEMAPELEYTGPSRIFSGTQTRDILATAMGSSGEMLREMRELRNEMRALVVVSQAGGQGTLQRLDAVVANTGAQARAVQRAADAAIVARSKAG